MTWTEVSKGSKKMWKLLIFVRVLGFSLLIYRTFYELWEYFLRKYDKRVNVAVFDEIDARVFVVVFSFIPPVSNSNELQSIKTDVISVGKLIIGTPKHKYVLPAYAYTDRCLYGFFFHRRISSIKLLYRRGKIFLQSSPTTTTRDFIFNWKLYGCNSGTIRCVFYKKVNSWWTLIFREEFTFFRFFQVSVINRS